MSFQLKKLNFMDSTKPFLKNMVLKVSEMKLEFSNALSFFNIRFNLSKVSFFIFQILLMDSTKLFLKNTVFEICKNESRVFECFPPYLNAEIFFILQILLTNEIKGCWYICCYYYQHICVMPLPLSSSFMCQKYVACNNQASYVKCRRTATTTAVLN